jgi:hypothetical protein
MAIKISGTTVIDDSRNLVNINSGLGVGIQSAGTAVGYGITQLNFAGVGNTFSVSGNTATITISGGGAGGGSLGVSSSGSIVASGVTNLNFVGVAITAVGLTTAVVTVTKTLTVGRRNQSASTLNLTTTSGSLLLRSGSSVSVPV